VPTVEETARIARLARSRHARSQRHTPLVGTMLDGALQEFGLVDLFHLLGRTGKSGCLRLVDEGREGRIYIREGQVTFAVADLRRIQFGARVLSAGLLTDEQIRDLPGSEDPQRELLARLAAGDTAALEPVVREHVVDAVFSLMRLVEGEFHFEASRAEDTQPVVALKAEDLVSECERRLGEWAGMQEHVPSLSAPLALAPQPPEPAGAEVSLTPDEWRLLPLIDGRRSVDDLAELTGAGEYETCRLVAGLARKRLVEVAEDGPSTLARLLERRARLRVLEPGAQQVSEPAEAAAPEPEAAAPEPEAEADSHTESEEQGAAEVAEEQADPVTVVTVPDHDPDADAPARIVAAARKAALGAQPEEPHRQEVAAGDPAHEPAAHGTVTPLAGKKREEPAAAAATAREPQREANRGAVDRADVARELASLGLNTPYAAAPGTPAQQPSEDESNKGLLLRLLDGVKNP
jgi:hypothetical protein